MINLSGLSFLNRDSIGLILMISGPVLENHLYPI